MNQFIQFAKISVSFVHEGDHYNAYSCLDYGQLRIRVVRIPCITEAREMPISISYNEGIELAKKSMGEGFIEYVEKVKAFYGVDVTLVEPINEYEDLPF